MAWSFEQPIWLLTVVLAAPLAWAGLRWFQSMSRARVWTNIALRSILIALISMMLAGATTVRKSDQLAVIALVDVSGSVRGFGRFGVGADGRPLSAPEAARDWLARAAGGRGPEDLLGVVVFDGSSLAVMAPRSGGVRGADEQLAIDFSLREGTNIADAIDFAAALFPPDAGKRLVLLSDGVQTTGDALEAAQRISAEGSGPRGLGVPIDVVPIAHRPAREVIVDFVDAPPQAARESTIAVRIGLRATQATTGTLFLRREGELVDLNPGATGTGRRVALHPGIQVLTLETPLDDRTIHRFEAIFTPDDESADELAANNRGEAFTLTPGKGRALIVDGVSDGAPNAAGATLARALNRAGVKAETISPAALPTDLLALHAYDIIILQNVSADEAPLRTHQLLVDYVQELGGGLVMVGGEDSLGPGGWKGTTLAQALPVELDLPEQLVTPSAAIVIVLDSSGSMANGVLGGTRTQQSVANDSASLAIRMLDETDLVGVLAFSERTRTVIPIGPNDDPDAAVRTVRSISPGGGTYMYPAMEQAATMLEGVDAKLKHVIVLTDGVSEGSPASGVKTAQRMTKNGITISTIGVGDRVDSQALQNIANAGGGTYHRVLDPSMLPRVFVREIRVVRKPLVREGDFSPQVLASGSPLTSGLSTDWPALGGYVRTRVKTEPGVVLAALTASGEPLLAHWNVGLGQAAVFTSDAHDWAQRWISTELYQQFWARVARTIARPATNQRYEIETSVAEESLRIELDAADDDGTPLDLLQVEALVYGPGEAEPVRTKLRQVGPGVYRGTSRAEQSGPYVVVLKPKLGSELLPPAIGGATKAPGAEFAKLGADARLLREIAKATGGRELSLAAPEEAELFLREGVEPSLAATPAWRALLVLALGVFLLDVGSRRVAWDRLVRRGVALEIGMNAAQRVREQSAQAAASVAQVRSRRSGRRAQQGGRKESAATADRLREKVKRARREPAAPEIAEKETEEERRTRIREALRVTTGIEPPKPPPAKKPEEEPADRSATTSELLAARRRAKDRYATDQDDEDDS